MREGTIGEAAAQRLEWMYQDKSAQSGGVKDANQAERFLLGEQIKELPGKEEREGKPKIIPCIRDTYATPENEAFLKMMEDPMFYIKQKELEARNQVLENPMKLKQIRAEIEALKEGKKKKKHKKDKKKKKHKKESRHSSKSKKSKHSRRSSSSERSRSSSPEHSRSSQSSRHHRHLNRDSSSRSRSRSYEDNRSGKLNKQTSHTTEISQNLGPDMSLYGQRQREIELMDLLRKQQKPEADVKLMTQEEKEAKIRQMQDYAQRMKEERSKKAGGRSDHPEHDESRPKDAKFLRDMGKHVYMDSEMGLEERINRKAHYRERER